MNEVTHFTKKTLLEKYAALGMNTWENNNDFQIGIELLGKIALQTIVNVSEDDKSHAISLPPHG